MSRSPTASSGSPSLAIDEQLALGGDIGPGHDILSGRYACYATYRTSDDRWLAVGAIEAKFFANLCTALGCPDLAAAQLDDGAQPRLRQAFAAAFATRTRDEWVETLAGADTCVAPVLDVDEVVVAPPVRRPPHGRHGDPPDRGHLLATGTPARRHGPPLSHHPVPLPDMTGDTDTEHLLKEDVVDGATVARRVEARVVA